MRLALVAAALLLWPATADASLGRWGLSTDGDPELLASPTYVSLHPPGDPVWRACPPGAACATIGGGTRPVRPGPIAAGTVFESDLTDENGTTTTERSPAWQGRVHAEAPPVIDGTPVAGGSVRVSGARWSGGWGDETSQVAIVACPGLGRTDCELLTGSGGYVNFGEGERPLKAKHVGWYLYAVDYRSARDRDPYVYASPIPPGAPTTPPVASPLAAVSAAVGPVAPAGTPPVVKPPVSGASPSVVMRKRALRHGRRIIVARVHCPVRCTVGLSVSDGHRTLRRTLHVRGSAPLAIMRGNRLRHGRLKVRVRVDGRLLASGTLS